MPIWTIPAVVLRLDDAFWSTVLGDPETQAFESRQQLSIMVQYLDSNDSYNIVIARAQFSISHTPATATTM